MSIYTNNVLLHAYMHTHVQYHTRIHFWSPSAIWMWPLQCCCCSSFLMFHHSDDFPNTFNSFNLWIHPNLMPDHWPIDRDNPWRTYDQQLNSWFLNRRNWITSHELEVAVYGWQTVQTLRAQREGGIEWHKKCTKFIVWWNQSKRTG